MQCGSSLSTVILTCYETPDYIILQADRDSRDQTKTRLARGKYTPMSKTHISTAL